MYNGAMGGEGLGEPKESSWEGFLLYQTQGSELLLVLHCCCSAPWWGTFSSLE